MQSFEFGRRLRLYTEETMTLPFLSHLATSLDMCSPDFDPVTFWPTVGTGEYHAEVKVSSLRTLPLRILAK